MGATGGTRTCFLLLWMNHVAKVGSHRDLVRNLTNNVRNLCYAPPRIIVKNT